jgi:hypothetical protein
VVFRSPLSKVDKFQDLGSADQVPTFSYPELLFQKLVNFRSSIRILFKYDLGITLEVVGDAISHLIIIQSAVTTGYAAKINSLKCRFLTCAP